MGSEERDKPLIGRIPITKCVCWFSVNVPGRKQKAQLETEEVLLSPHGPNSSRVCFLCGHPRLTAERPERFWKPFTTKKSSDVQHRRVDGGWRVVRGKNQLTEGK